MTDAAQAIAVTDLHKRFGSLEVLKGVSLSAQQGDVIAIIGGSGSGKSTLLRCINMLELPSAGQISVHGEEIRMKPDGRGGLMPADRKQVQRIRTQLGMVFQSFNLWQHMTILQNVIEVPVHVLGKSKAEALETAEALLRRVGLYEKRDAYPAFLSGGQQQRAAIARALAIQPLVMLVTHEMKFARDVASHIVFLHNGVIEEQGPPEAIFGAPKSERLKKFISSIH
ncbi:histidine/lysine/arginine/ornithine ABC transporter ATP-binding protein [Sinorhizobium medicae]|nr:histidine/lysine/arginine/ornithine ABC transporter ATP-binding protein [Sinorhizobium medicae]